MHQQPEDQGDQKLLGCCGVEHAAMAARLNALRHDRIDPSAAAPA
ncbi:hypothetical protein ACEUZ9_004582 [Paracoccus litorisediminis]